MTGDSPGESCHDQTRMKMSMIGMKNIRRNGMPYNSSKKRAWCKTCGWLKQYGNCTNPKCPKFTKGDAAKPANPAPIPVRAPLSVPDPKTVPEPSDQIEPDETVVCDREPPFQVRPVPDRGGLSKKAWKMIPVFDGSVEYKRELRRIDAAFYCSVKLEECPRHGQCKIDTHYRFDFYHPNYALRFHVCPHLVIRAEQVNKEPGPEPGPAPGAAEPGPGPAPGPGGP